MPLVIVGGLVVIVDPENDDRVAMMFVDPKAQSQVPNQHYYLVRGSFKREQQNGTQNIYDYAIHVYCNVKYEDEAIERLIHWFIDQHKSELSWKSLEENI
ncbi:MAG: hypothetical protein IPK17_32655 [Chloroflexi bacterium]|uniref:hypothetical protein n=1 Tax=Candidatus Flexifilum breve TaxID=3140694 RepID=UPI00313466D9|nr:hypothetical protein [Chloroflexota bacterium]